MGDHIKMKKFLTLALALVFLFSATACNDGKKDDPVVTGNVKVCTASNLEKVLQNKAYDSGKLKLEIKAFRNEYEAAQIIMTPDYDVRSYTLTLSNLTCGENILGKENFELFHEKYIELERDVEGESRQFYNGISPYQNRDMAPDALLPMASAIEYSENVIAKDNNQGIYVSVKIPKEQPAGVYTGNFILDVDGNKTTIPVEVTVWDYAISDEVHVKSCFAVMFDCNKYGEANITKYMEKLYTENLLNFRLQPQYLPILLAAGSYYSESQISEWLDSVVEYAQDPRMAFINIPVNSVANVEVDGVVYSRLTNMDLYESTLTETAKRSLKEGINLFEKMDCIVRPFDESEQNGNVDNQEKSLFLMKQLQANLATEWKAAVANGTWFAEEGYTYDSDFAYEIIETMRTIKLYNTDSSDGVMRSDTEFAGIRFEPGDPDLDVIYRGENYKKRDAYYEFPTSYIIRSWEFDYSASVDFYNKYLDWYNEYYNTDDAEQWMYSAVYPHYPYLGYLLDSDLLMQRSIGWMMQRYNVKGIESWYTNMYRDMPGYNKGFEVITDPYANSSRFPETNGDGFITYPGMPYGIEGPINTMRIHSLRDSNEDYEVLYLLEQEYKKVIAKAGLEYNRREFEAMVEYINERFFEHDRVKIGQDMNENFFAAREALVSLLDMVTKTETVITGYEKLAEKAVLTFLSTDASDMTLDGEAVSKQQFAGYKTFTVEIGLSDIQSYDLVIDTDTTSVDVTVALGYSNEQLSAEDIKNIFSASVADGSAAIVGGVYKYTLAAGSDRYFDLDFTGYNISNISGELWISVYNYGTADVTFNLEAAHTNNTKFKTFANRYGLRQSKVTSITLKPGENLVKIPNFILLWNAVGQRIHGRYEALATLRFNATSTAQIQLGFGQITLER